VLDAEAHGLQDAFLGLLDGFAKTVDAREIVTVSVVTLAFAFDSDGIAVEGHLGIKFIMKGRGGRWDLAAAHLQTELAVGFAVAFEVFLGVFQLDAMVLQKGVDLHARLKTKQLAQQGGGDFAGAVGFEGQASSAARDKSWPRRPPGVRRGEKW
jgi:hypothetical protein